MWAAGVVVRHGLWVGAFGASRWQDERPAKTKAARPATNSDPFVMGGILSREFLERFGHLRVLAWRDGAQVEQQQVLLDSSHDPGIVGSEILRQLVTGELRVSQREGAGRKCLFRAGPAPEKTRGRNDFDDKPRAIDARGLANPVATLLE